MKNSANKIIKIAVSIILALVIAAGVAYVAPAEKADARSSSFVYMYEVTNSQNNFWLWQSSSITVKNNTSNTIYVSVTDANTYVTKVVNKAVKPGKTYKYSFKSGTYRISASSSYWGGFAKLDLSGTSRATVTGRFTAY